LTGEDDGGAGMLLGDDEAVDDEASLSEDDGGAGKIGNDSSLDDDDGSESSV
jgi:hypothetical protein